MVATIFKALILELDNLGDLNRGGNGKSNDGNGQNNSDLQEKGNPIEGVGGLDNFHWITIYITCHWNF